MSGRVLVEAAAASLLVALVATGCGGGPVGPVASPSPGAPSASDTPAAAAGPADLTIAVDDGAGAGARTTWRLSCDPVGGTHPDPEAACTILAAHGDLALPPKGKDIACTEIYGGPEKATVTGTWRGQPVRSTFSRTDGCEISRWDLMQGLLPRAAG